MSDILSQWALCSPIKKNQCYSIQVRRFWDGNNREVLVNIEIHDGKHGMCICLNKHDMLEFCMEIMHGLLDRELEERLSGEKDV